MCVYMCVCIYIYILYMVKVLWKDIAHIASLYIRNINVDKEDHSHTQQISHTSTSHTNAGVLPDPLMGLHMCSTHRTTTLHTHKRSILFTHTLMPTGQKSKVSSLVQAYDTQILLISFLRNQSNSLSCIRVLNVHFQVCKCGSGIWIPSPAFSHELKYGWIAVARHFWPLACKHPACAINVNMYEFVYIHLNMAELQLLGISGSSPACVVSICMRIHTHMHIYVIYTYIHICIYNIYTYICMHAYIYTHTHTHIYIYIAW
jgi:hypothetical protein